MLQNVYDNIVETIASEILNREKYNICNYFENIVEFSESFVITDKWIWNNLNDYLETECLNLENYIHEAIDSELAFTSDCVKIINDVGVRYALLTYLKSKKEVILKKIPSEQDVAEAVLYNDYYPSKDIILSEMFNAIRLMISENFNWKK